MPEEDELLELDEEELLEEVVLVELPLDDELLDEDDELDDELLELDEAV